MKSLIKNFFSTGGLSNTPNASEITSFTNQPADESSEGQFDADDIEYWASLEDDSANDSHYKKDKIPAQHCASNRPDLVPSIPSCVKSGDNIVLSPQGASAIPEIGQTSSNLHTSDFQTDSVFSNPAVTVNEDIDLGEFHAKESADLLESVSGEIHIQRSNASPLNLIDEALESPYPADNNEIDVDLCESDASQNSEPLEPISYEAYISVSDTSPLGEIDEGLQTIEPVDINELESDLCEIDEYEGSESPELYPYEEDIEESDTNSVIAIEGSFEIPASLVFSDNDSDLYEIDEYEDHEYTGLMSHVGHLEESDNDVPDLPYRIDLDGYEENHLRQDVSISGAKVSEESRAREKVLQVTQKYDCSEKVVSLLYDYVLEKGWGAALTNVAFHLERGMTDVEFELAFHLREYWSNSTEFSATSGRHAKSSLSWELALDLVNSFSSYPEKEELEVLLSNCHERWCGSFRMRDEYFSFQDYLRRLCASRFSTYMVAPDLSMIDAGFHILHDDDFTSDRYSGKHPQVLPYERGFISTAIPHSRKKYR